ncbi:MAG: 1-phosphofructokinase [Acidobacteriota bacterium]
MIYTVTLNPALDRTMVVEKLLDEDTVRVISETSYAGGKGIDVSRAIHELGGETVAMGLLGGYDGMKLEGLLINAGILTDFTRISGETRTNIILKEKEPGRQYVISASGPEIDSSEIGAFYQHLLSVPRMDYLVMSGSLPRGVSPNVYGQIVLAGKRKNGFILLDADGEALRQAVAYSPDAIKPNRFELSRLVGKELENERDVALACDEVHRMGVRYVLVSMGKKGMILSTGDSKLKAVAPAVKTDSAVGAGDSSVAGFILALSQGKDLSDCIRLACAAGTATAMTPGTELCHRKDVEELLDRVEISSL